MNTLAIDIGGTGLKMLVLDESGQPTHPAYTAPTPRPATPRAIHAVLDELAKSCPPFDRISAGFPGIVTAGHTRNAPNLGEGWEDHPLAEELSARLGQPARVANDADIQGYGAIEGNGVELTITLGTGVGSGLFVDGTLVPNLELGHAPFREGRSYEQILGMTGRNQLGHHSWQEALFIALDQWHRLFSPVQLHLGGGHAQTIHRPLPPRTRVVHNRAGLLGGIALWRD